MLSARVSGWARLSLEEDEFDRKISDIIPKVMRESRNPMIFSREISVKIKKVVNLCHKEIRFITAPLDKQRAQHLQYMLDINSPYLLKIFNNMNQDFLRNTGYNRQEKYNQKLRYIAAMGSMRAGRPEKLISLLVDNLIVTYPGESIIDFFLSKKDDIEFLSRQLLRSCSSPASAQLKSAMFRVGVGQVSPQGFSELPRATGGSPINNPSRLHAPVVRQVKYMGSKSGFDPYAEEQGPVPRKNTLVAAKSPKNSSGLHVKSVRKVEYRGSKSGFDPYAEEQGPVPRKNTLVAAKSASESGTGVFIPCIPETQKTKLPQSKAR
jgi:hypothetical protein